MFYVYAHLRKTDGSVFYIGKGSGDRAFVKSGRNKMWNYVFDKHGCTVVILSRWGKESEAFKEECRQVDLIGINNLTNMSLGGAGASGVKFSAERKNKARVHLNIVGKKHRDFFFLVSRKNKKRIYTEDGRSFLGAKKVSEWMTSIGIESPGIHRISHAARVGGTHKGIKLRYKTVDYRDVKSPRAIQVGNDDGEIFPSITEASREMIRRGLKSSPANIHNAISGLSVTSSGKKWGRVVNGEIKFNESPRRTKNKQILRSDGLIFDSLKEAAEKTSESKYANRNISLAANKKTKTAYGYEWEYL